MKFRKKDGTIEEGEPVQVLGRVPHMCSKECEKTHQKPQKIEDVEPIITNADGTCSVAVSILRHKINELIKAHNKKL